MNVHMPAGFPEPGSSIRSYLLCNSSFFTD